MYRIGETQTWDHSERVYSEQKIQSSTEVGDHKLVVVQIYNVVWSLSDFWIAHVINGCTNPLIKEMALRLGKYGGGTRWRVLRSYGL